MQACCVRGRMVQKDTSISICCIHVISKGYDNDSQYAEHDKEYVSKYLVPFLGAHDVLFVLFC